MLLICNNDEGLLHRVGCIAPWTDKCCISGSNAQLMTVYHALQDHYPAALQCHLQNADSGILTQLHAGSHSEKRKLAGHSHRVAWTGREEWTEWKSS